MLAAVDAEVLEADHARGLVRLRGLLPLLQLEMRVAQLDQDIGVVLRRADLAVLLAGGEGVAPRALDQQLVQRARVGDRRDRRREEREQPPTTELATHFAQEDTLSRDEDDTYHVRVTSVPLRFSLR